MMGRANAVAALSGKAPHWCEYPYFLGAYK